ncbi:zinc-dependent peptidase [Burkholderiaceae bacterium DAT-1]|nr:zinc-dependent peptidase [Burkholderiaceae bacterium DAT-1]
MLAALTSMIKAWIKPADPLDTPVWQQIRSRVPQLAMLDEPTRTGLEKQMRRFLRSKSISGAEDLTITPAMRLLIAAFACLPVAALDTKPYRDWHEVIVYPSAFLSQERWQDAAGLTHESQRPLDGMARGDGPVLLSWPAVLGSLQRDGGNVVIHEIAHKLDMMRGGEANGAPPLHAGMSYQDWKSAFTYAWQDTQAKVAWGEPSVIGAYGATSPAEFFAVSSERFFEAPQALAQAYPGVYAQLRAFYRQDPLSRYHTTQSVYETSTPHHDTSSMMPARMPRLH